MKYWSNNEVSEIIKNIENYAPGDDIYIYNCFNIFTWKCVNDC